LKLTSFTVFALCLFTAASAFAKKGLVEDASGQGYGTAGCGLGSILFGQQEGGIQIIAATFNGTSANQTFAITSGTSNCVPGAGSHRAELFITVNKEALAKDISRGRGETVDGLASILGCPDSRALGTQLQSHFSQIFPNEKTDGAQVTHSIFGVIRGASDLTCRDLG
jgi:hypothetical protein